MRDIAIEQIKNTINVLRHLVHECPGATKLLEEQIASLELAIDCIEIWWKE